MEQIDRGRMQAPHDQGSHHNIFIIELIGVFLVSTVNSEVIHWIF